MTNQQKVDSQIIKMHSEFDIQNIKIKRLQRAIQTQIDQLEALQTDQIQSARRNLAENKPESAENNLKLKAIFCTQISSLQKQNLQLQKVLNDLRVAQGTTAFLDVSKDVNSLLSDEVMTAQNDKLQEILRLSTEVEKKQAVIDTLYQGGTQDIQYEMDILMAEIARENGENVVVEQGQHIEDQRQECEVMVIL
eukprot:EST45051.1 Hypothetical protein SS50377_15071 [Spironucleus salmonicida]